MKKLFREYALLTVFVFIMGGLFLLDLCFTANPYSELENRKLKQKPAFSLDALLRNQLIPRHTRPAAHISHFHPDAKTLQCFLKFRRRLQQISITDLCLIFRFGKQ